jgi:hypothetical protein
MNAPTRIITAAIGSTHGRIGDSGERKSSRNAPPVAPTRKINVPKDRRIPQSSLHDSYIPVSHAKAKKPATSSVVQSIVSDIRCGNKEVGLMYTHLYQATLPACFV